MWRHLWHLLSHSWDSLVAAMGTTTLAIVVGFVGFLFILSINLVFKLRKDGWKWSVMVSHFSQNLKDSAVPTIIGNLMLWAVLFGIFVIKTVYNDHQELVGKVARLKAAPTPTCPTCPPSVKEQPHCWLSEIRGGPITDDSLSSDVAVMHCNFRIDAPWCASATFDKDTFSGGMAFTSNFVTPGRPEKQGNTFKQCVSSPSIPAHDLVTVTVYGTEKDAPRLVSGWVKSQ